MSESDGRRNAKSEMHRHRADAERALDAIFLKDSGSESKRRKENSLPRNARTRPDCWQEQALNKCKDMPESEEKYQELKRLAKAFEEMRRTAVTLRDSENERNCESYLERTLEMLNDLAPEYEEQERFRMIQKARQEREELRALRSGPNFLFDSDQQFARGGFSLPESEEESATEMPAGWQKRYFNYYNKQPNSTKKVEKLKELAEKLEDQMRIALRKKDFIYYTECQSYLDKTERAIKSIF